MLVVFHGSPGAAPGEAVFEEEAVAEVALLYLVAERLLTIDIGFAIRGFYDTGAILAGADVGIVAGVDVDGQATGMKGELGAA